MKEVEEVLPDRLVVVVGDVVVGFYFQDCLRAEEVDLLAPERELRVRRDPALLDPAHDAAGAHEELAGGLLLIEIVAVFLFKCLRIDLHDPLDALDESVDLHHIADPVIAPQDAPERHVKAVLKDRVHGKRLHRRPVLVHHIDYEYVLLRARPPKPAPDLLEVEHLRHRGARHDEDPELRVVPALRDHVAGAKEPDLLLAKCRNHRVRILPGPGVGRRADPRGAEDLLHLPRMPHIHAEYNPLKPPLSPLGEVLREDICDEFISRIHPEVLFEVCIYVIPAVKPHLRKVEVGLDPVDARLGDDLLLHGLAERKPRPVRPENGFKPLLIRPVVGRGEPDHEIRGEVLDDAAHAVRHRVVRLVDHDVRKMLRRIPREIYREVRICADLDPAGEGPEGSRAARLPVGGDGARRRGDERPRLRVRREVRLEVFEGDLRLPARGGEHR